MLSFEHHAILSRQYSDELRRACFPLIDDSPRDRALGVLEVAHDQRVQLLQLVGVIDRSQLDHPEVASRWERTIFVEHVGDPAAHAGCDVASCFTEPCDQAAGHVFASMIADSLAHRMRAAVAPRESLAGPPAEKRLTAGRAVERDVSDDDVLFGLEGRFLWRAHRDESAGQPLAAVVIGITLEVERDARREPRAETLACGTVQMNLNRVWGKALGGKMPRDFGRQHCPDRAIHIANRQMNLDRLATYERVVC